MTAVNRNPVKQIMSDVHKDLRAGKLVADGHDGFIAEVKRRLAAAGLYRPSDHEENGSIDSFEDIVRLTREHDPPRSA
jgi:hypothetical protein